jgi:fumarate reductase (CoM/CoB) subunit B
MENKVRELADKCIECGLCGRNCPLLAELGESPGKAAARGATACEAFSCALCGGCEAVCPAGLSPKELFVAGRRTAVAAGEFKVDDYRHLFPDRKNNLMNVYRRFSGIDYEDIAVQGEAASCFFPGCTLMTYAPGLTREVYARLRDGCGCDGTITECCSKPLAQMGLPRRADDAARRLVASLRAHRVRELIVACPGCYYELRSLLSPAGIMLRTVYEALEPRTAAAEAGGLCTVHDSCPDRFEGIFGRQVRELLAKSGLSPVEMAHGKENTSCCGSGGMLSTFRPDFTDELVGWRMAEARATGAGLLVSYCASCTAKLAAAADGIRADHALSLLLGRRDDFTAAKKRMAAMLEGPGGAELWARIMAD